MLNEPCTPLRMFYLDEVLDPDTQQVVIQQSSRPSPSPTGLYIIRPKKIIILPCNNINSNNLLLTHIDADVDHLINLHVDQTQAVWILILINCGLSCDNRSHKMDPLMYQKLKLNGKTINNLIMIYREMSHQLLPCPNIFLDFKTSSTREAIQAAQLILNARRLFSLASMHVDTPSSLA